MKKINERWTFTFIANRRRNVRNFWKFSVKKREIFELPQATKIDSVYTYTVCAAILWLAALSSTGGGGVGGKSSKSSTEVI